VVIVGVNAYHGDASACLVVDGRLVCAIEEERIVRKKHWAGFPVESIRWCLKRGGVSIGDVDYIAVSRAPWSHLPLKVMTVLKNVTNIGFVTDRLRNVTKVRDVRAAIAEELGAGLRAEVVNVEHHRAHIGSAFLVSPFDEAACVSVDGFGDLVSTMRGVGRGNAVEILDWVGFPHSLGICYTAITQFLGFWNYGDEYKVMGLSAYGEPTYLEAMRRIVTLRPGGTFKLDPAYFLHARKGVAMTWDGGEPSVGQIFSDEMIRLLGPPRAKGEELSQRQKDIAASLQAWYEEVFFEILKGVHEKTGSDKLALAGGCVQNSLANGKIQEKTPFRDIYIPPAAHDGGTSVGAAFWTWNVILGRPREFVMESAYWGPDFAETEMAEALASAGVSFEELPEDDLCRRVAEDIEAGKIVGWFQGRTEWGPRALGNRSIVVDPRRAEMKEVLNSRTKRREWFRPFAPSVLEEKGGEWFEAWSAVPFMERVYRIRAEKRDLIPAVAHVDGTGRLQTVSRATNPRYHKLIEEFGRRTGVPIVLNTSFNENEPIVNTPEEAVACFKRADMDVLVLGRYYVSAKPGDFR
jgi:carbamoyltransferase